MPWTPTAAFPSPMVRIMRGVGPDVSGFLNKLSYYVMAGR